MLRRTQSISAQAEPPAGSLAVDSLRVANERLLAMGSGRHAQASPVELMREALHEPEDDLPQGDLPETAPPREPAPPRAVFAAAPAMPLADDPSPTFVVKPSEGRAGRRAMDELREQALRNVIASAAAANQSSRQNIRRGQPLLSPSRIILLAVALITGGLAAFLAAQVGTPPETAPASQPIAAPTVQVLVARDAIGIGQRVTADIVEWTAWPEASVRAEFVTATAMPEAIAEMEGAVARGDIAAGEPILPAKLVEPNGSYLAGVLEPGMRGVSIPIGAASASGGFVAPNDRVDVIVTRTFEMRRVTETILRNVRVLALNGRLGAESGDGQEPAEGSFSGETLATLELNTAQGELLINAAATGEITLVLRSISDMTETQPVEQRTANQLIRSTSPFWSAQ